MHLCFKIYFLREQFWRTSMFWNLYFEGAILRNTYVLKSMNNLFKIYGCWLVWLLLYIFMAADLIKVFTTSKTFAILTCINTNLRCIKIVDYCESNKQMGWVCVSRISMKPCNFQGTTAGSQWSLDKRRLYQNVGKDIW